MSDGDLVTHRLSRYLTVTFNPHGLIFPKYIMILLALQDLGSTPETNLELFIILKLE